MRYHSLHWVLLPLLIIPAESAWAANYPVAAGTGTATVQSTINAAAAAGGGNTVTFAAGSYSLSQITIPCPVSPLVITGPATTYPANWNARPTAVITSTYTSEGPAIFNIATPCSTAVSILYLEINGNRPTSGGGAIYVGQGGRSNLTIGYNYFHGNQLPVPTLGCGGTCYLDGDINATLIYLDGYQDGNTDSNITITNNIFGNPIAGDCSGVMSWIGGDLSNGTFFGYDQVGGTCAAYGSITNLTNLTFEYNVIQQQEQGMKFYEGGTAAPNLFVLTNVVVEYNDFGFYHRIGTEAQQSPTNASLPFVWSYNDMHDPVVPSFGNWGLSSPQLSYTVANNNVMITNTSAGGSAGPGNFEWWGDATNNNNLEQGYTGCGTQFGFGVSPSASVSNNILQLSTTSCSTTLSGGTVVKGIEDEYPANIPAANYPSMTGNTFSSTSSAITSTTPSISPGSGSFSGAQTVTITDAGNVSGPGPIGNVGIWYTTDGSTPAPKSGTSTFCSSPCSLVLTSTTTVKAVGMWGAITQPASYPAGYGFVPSPIANATYTSGATPTVATPVLSPESESFTGTISVAAATATTGATLYCTTNGGTPTTSSPVYTGPLTLSATTTVQCMGTATAFLNSAIGSATYTLSSLNPTVTSGYLGNNGSVNTLVVGAAAIQFTAYANYSNGTTGTLPDGYGNTAVWSSSNTNILSVSSTGLVSCVTTGSANVRVTSSPGAIGFNPWTMMCTAAPPAPTLTSVSLATTGSITALAVDAANQILATCHYSDGSTTACNSSDLHGNTVSVWTTSAASIVSLSTSGLATGVAVGTANLTATVAGLTSPELSLTVTSTHTLTGAYLSTPGNANTLDPGSTLQFSALCTYSNGATQDCTVTDLYGDAVSRWVSSQPSVMSIGNVGTSTPGLATAITAGSANAQATIDGSLMSNPWTVTVSSPTVNLTGITLATTGGVTGVFVGQTNQILATCLYSDGSTTHCNATDSHGNKAVNFASSATTAATVNATTGIVTGIGAGSTNLTAQAGSFTSPNLPLTIALVPTGTYTITISGQVRFTGKVSF